MVNHTSYYRIECYACTETVTLPAINCQQTCPNCGAVLRIDWHGEHGAFDQQEREAQHT
jgi:hypothetical protein